MHDLYIQPPVHNHATHATWPEAGLAWVPMQVHRLTLELLKVARQRLEAGGLAALEVQPPEVLLNGQLIIRAHLGKVKSGFGHVPVLQPLLSIQSCSAASALLTWDPDEAEITPLVCPLLMPAGSHSRSSA